ncbi:hypothetical protein MXB_1739 [Myxobolus squamalis]|nr:hypothetical protein MXB_1739 [Myxobolus squamalis]
MELSHLLVSLHASAYLGRHSDYSCSG